MDIPINYFAVAVAAMVPMVIGFLWYGPFFGKPWIHMTGFTDASMDVAKSRPMWLVLLLQFIGALFISFVMAHSLIFASAYLQSSGLVAGLTNAFWNWIGFMVPATMGVYLWEGKSWKLWALNAGYYLVSMLIMGAILALWV